MFPRQVEGGLEVGFVIGLEGDVVQGAQAFLDLSLGESPAPLNSNQGVARLQMPELWHERHILCEAIEYPIRPWVVFIV